MLLNKTTQLNGIIAAISGDDEASWLSSKNALKNKQVQLLLTQYFYISSDLND